MSCSKELTSDENNEKLLLLKKNQKTKKTLQGITFSNKQYCSQNLSFHNKDI